MINVATNVSLLDLFIEFFKIGLIMFGGGYGGIGIYYRIVVEEKKWISQEDFLRILGIAESTPGPIAINAATWIGYELKSIPGSIAATLGVVFPAYLTTLIIVLALRPYMDHWIAKALFRGVNVAVLAIILYAFVSLSRSIFLKTGLLDLVAVIIFVFAIVLMFLFKTHPVIIIVSTGVLSLLLKTLFGV